MAVYFCGERIKNHKIDYSESDDILEEPAKIQAYCPERFKENGQPKWDWLKVVFAN